MADKINLEGIFATGKTPQIKKSPICNPKSKRYNPIVAKRRLKEKARRKHNATMRARGK